MISVIPIHCTHENTFQVQNSSFYYSITAPANATVIALSVLLIIVGVFMAATSICQLVAGRKELDDDLGDIVPYIIKFSIEIVRLCIANI